MRLRFAGGVDAHISREENEKYRQLVADNTAWVQQHYRYSRFIEVVHCRSDIQGHRKYRPYCLQCHPWEYGKVTVTDVNIFDMVYMDKSA